MPGAEESAVLALTHLLGLGFPLAAARHVADIVLKGEAPPEPPLEMDPLERAQRARQRTASLVGQALLKVQLARDARLTADDIDRVVAAVRALELESNVYLHEVTDPLSADRYDDEFGVRNTLLPGLRTAQTLPEHMADMLALNAVPDDFDGETALERELERRDAFRRNVRTPPARGVSFPLRVLVRAGRQACVCQARAHVGGSFLIVGVCVCSCGATS